jgi:filamentous hemagglutinin family protein
MNSIPTISVTGGFLFCLSIASLPATAQVTTDGTTSTTVNTNGNNFEINDGDRAGSNLFHSFRDFSVRNGGEAFFNNANDIVNIFSRVTGGNISNIDGLLRANGSANLFLINPAGIIFGNNARLDIGGSFYGTSADSILFEDGEFSATDLDNPPLLTINAPIGLSFRDNPGEIINNSAGNGLQVSAGETLALIGGNVTFDGGNIIAPSANVEIGGLTESGIVNISNSGSLTFPESITRADITLTDGASVNVAANGGGFITVNARNLNLSGESQLLTGIAEDSTLPNSQAGNIEIDSNTLIARNNSQILNQVLGIGNAGKIEINTESLEFTEGSAIITSTFGLGNGGDIEVNVTGNATFDLDLGGIYSQVGLQRNDTIVNGVAGNAGSVNLQANALSLTNGARITTKTAGEGNGGNINLNIANTTSIDSKGIAPTNALTSGIFTQATGDAIGNSGNIEINTGNLRLTNNTFIAADSFGIGDAGNIIINASGTVFQADFSLLITQIQPNAEGNGGNIEINTQNLILVDSLILSDSKGIGNAGNIEINATQDISLQDTDNPQFPEGSLIISGVGILGDDTQGNAGNIEITTKSLSLEGSSFILAQTNGLGNSGDIVIQSQEGVFLNNSSRIVAQVEENAIGDGGEININSPRINLNGFSSISTNTLAEGQGKAGNINLDTNTLSIVDTAIIEALTENNFDGGNISISANTVDLLGGGKIITATNSNGNAGNISLNISDSLNISGNNSLFAELIDALTQDEIIRAENPTQADDRFRFATPSNILNILGASSGLFANTTNNATGNGGNIEIRTPRQFNLSDRALISVSSQGQGSAGDISINASLLTLDNNASIQASTSSIRGGNINLKINDTLTLDNNSTISAEATNNADGGNLNIDTNFIVAFPNQNNDIIANAQQGNGGDINITAESIFGIQERPLNNFTNDINASSALGAQFDGTVAITIPDINAIQTETQVPNNLIESDKTPEQACQSNRINAAKNGLDILGKGGIPPEAIEPLQADNIIIDSKFVANYIPPEIKPIETDNGDIYPARGIIKTADGGIILTAYPTDNTQRIPHRSLNCNQLNRNGEVEQ